MRKNLILVYLAILFVTGCSPSEPENSSTDTDLTIYSGITMIRPLSVLVQEFEKKHGINIEIKQGASGYLYKTIKTEQKGDLFLPGSESYRIKSQNAGEKLLLNNIFVGYNRIAIVVAKDNPKNLTNDVAQLANPKYSVVLSAPDSSAVGKNTKQILDKRGLTSAVYDNVTYFTTDSHRIFRAIELGHADVALNWYATTKWPETEDIMEAILLPEEIAHSKRLELNLLSFSKNPEMAIEFMNYASSKHGLETFASYGFLTEKELSTALSNIKPLSQSGK
ncbi:MAG: substrate-binding domain-containing protein [Pseudomonadota bacterium]|nr:substrate-binding domain-containing protein [Pseudomonadota bacterium]